MSNILILGASSSIAKALSHKFAKEKYSLILAGRDVSEVAALACDIGLRYGVTANSIYFDALDYSSHVNFFNQSIELYGEITGIVLAYGYMGEQKKAEADFHEAEQVLKANFVSCVPILEMAAEYFEKQGKGWICAISSVAGDRGRQSNYIYGSAKGALSLYLQGLRNRLSQANVQVITIKPGFVDTKMTFGLLKESPLVAKPTRVAGGIYKAIKAGKNVAYVPGFWGLIMLIIKHIPESIFKKLNL